VAETPSRPGAVRGAATLWFAASVAGLFGVVMALADGDGLRERLTATAYDTDPAATADAVGDAVRMTILVVLGTVVGLTVLGWCGRRCCSAGGRGRAGRCWSPAW